MNTPPCHESSLKTKIRGRYNIRFSDLNLLQKLRELIRRRNMREINAAWKQRGKRTIKPCSPWSSHVYLPSLSLNCIRFCRDPGQNSGRTRVVFDYLEFRPYCTYAVISRTDFPNLKRLIPFSFNPRTLLTKECFCLTLQRIYSCYSLRFNIQRYRKSVYSQLNSGHWPN